MRRRSFLKLLGLGGAVAAVPAVARETGYFAPNEAGTCAGVRMVTRGGPELCPRCGVGLDRFLVGDEVPVSHCPKCFGTFTPHGGLVDALGEARRQAAAEHPPRRRASRPRAKRRKRA